MKKKKNIFVALFLFFTIFLSGFLYKDSFNAYFFQDDWFTLKISQAKNFSEFLHFFVPRSDVIYYRPLGMQVPFFILRSIFGINPFPFHLLTFTTHAVNIFLVFILVNLLSKNIFVSLLSAFFYGISLIHFTPFFWSATYSFILGPAFFFLSFIFFLQKKIKISAICYLVGVLANEMVIVLPFILIMYQFLYKKRKKLLKIPLIYLFLGSLIFFVRFVLFFPPIGGDYEVALSISLINNLKAYFLWSFNWPEEMKAQFTSFWLINFQFIRDFWRYFWIFILTFFINICFFYLIPIFLFFLKKELPVLKEIIFGISWFLIGLFPVLLFPNHAFSYYLPISFVGLFFTSTILFKYFIETISNFYKLKKFTFIPIIILFLNWLISSLYSLDFNLKVHWAPRRAKIAWTLINKVYVYYPYRGWDYPYVYITPSSENKLALNNQDALKVVFNDESITTIYGYIFGKTSI